MNETLEELYRSLDQRHRPEDVAVKVEVLLREHLDPATRAALAEVTRHSRPQWWSWMSSDFARPPGMGR